MRFLLLNNRWLFDNGLMSIEYCYYLMNIWFPWPWLLGAAGGCDGDGVDWITVSDQRSPPPAQPGTVWHWDQTCKRCFMMLNNTQRRCLPALSHYKEYHQLKKLSTLFQAEALPVVYSFVLIESRICGSISKHIQKWQGTSRRLHCGVLYSIVKHHHCLHVC